MSNSSPIFASYIFLMACRIIALDKGQGMRPELRPVEIGETLHRDLSELVLRAAGIQAKVACGNLQLCAGI